MIPSKHVYSAYEVVCEREGTDPLKIRRVRDLSSELAFLSLIDQDRKGRGKGKGAHTINQLIDAPNSSSKRVSRRDRVTSAYPRL